MEKKHKSEAIPPAVLLYLIPPIQPRPKEAICTSLKRPLGRGLFGLI